MVENNKWPYVKQKQSSRQENFMDSHLSKFIMKRIKTKEQIKTSPPTLVWCAFSYNAINLAHSQMLPSPAYYTFNSMSDYMLPKWESSVSARDDPKKGGIWVSMVWKQTGVTCMWINRESKYILCALSRPNRHPCFMQPRISFLQSFIPKLPHSKSLVIYNVYCINEMK